MKTELPDTQAELLTYLRDNPKGMTTGQLFTMTRQKRYFKFKNSTNVSACINAMRTKNLITTSEAHGGKVHKITQFGLDQLKDESSGLPPSATPKPSEVDHVTMAALADKIITTVQNDESAELSTKTYPINSIVELPVASIDQTKQLPSGTAHRLDQIFDEIKCMICTCKPVQIADKKTKMAVLERVAGFVRVEDADWLNRIWSDLEMME